jgi:hypothetical protein
MKPVPTANVILLALAMMSGLVLAQQQPPIRSGVELVLVDVQVVDRRGKPIPGLGASDFRVQIDRGDRKIVSVELRWQNTRAERRWCS